MACLLSSPGRPPLMRSLLGYRGDRRDYEEATWKADYGIARDLYSGGGVDAFCDGHLAFQRIAKTTTTDQDIAPEANRSPASKAIRHNRWYPG